MIQKSQSEVYLKVKDYSVSGEIFDLIYNQELELLETFPKPSLEKLPEYYKSDNYISHTDTQRNLFEKAYHLVRKLSLNRKVKLINSFLIKEKKLLDVGCGTGDFLNACKNDGWDVIGIEPNKSARIIANNKVEGSIFNSDKLEQLNPASFNVITLWHVLEHLPELENHISIFKKLLKPNGVLLIAVPNYKSYDAIYYKEFWAAYDVPRHLWHFSKESISKLVSKENMRVAKIKPMWFDAFYVSLLSEKYKSGRMNIFKAFFIGSLSNLKSLKTKEASSLIYVIKTAEN